MFSSPPGKKRDQPQGTQIIFWWVCGPRSETPRHISAGFFCFKKCQFDFFLKIFANMDLFFSVSLPKQWLIWFLLIFFGKFLVLFWRKSLLTLSYQYTSVHLYVVDPSKLVLHQTVSRLLSSPNIQSGKNNEMDPILIGTAVSKHVIKEMSKPAVPLVKALWRTIILSMFMITSWLIIHVTVVEQWK